MIKTRLVRLLSHAKKYIVYNIPSGNTGRQPGGSCSDTGKPGCRQDGADPAPGGGNKVSL